MTVTKRNEEKGMPAKESVTVTKGGRKPLHGEAMSDAGRQRRARSLAMSQLCDGNEKGISTSSLIALLPKLFSNKHGQLVETVCKELIHRAKKGA